MTHASDPLFHAIVSSAAHPDPRVRARYRPFVVESGPVVWPVWVSTSFAHLRVLGGAASRLVATGAAALGFVGASHIVTAVGPCCEPAGC